MTFQKTKIPIKCENCGYEWKYKGKLKRTTCPNCGNKTRTFQETPSTLNPEEDPISKLIREYLQS